MSPIEKVKVLATRSKANLARYDNDDMRDQIVDTADASGHINVWIEVFGDDPDMVQRLAALSFRKWLNEKK